MIHLLLGKDRDSSQNLTHRFRKELHKQILQVQIQFQTLTQYLDMPPFHYALSSHFNIFTDQNYQFFKKDLSATQLPFSLTSTSNLDFDQELKQEMKKCSHKLDMVGLKQQLQLPKVNIQYYHSFFLQHRKGQSLNYIYLNIVTSFYRLTLLLQNYLSKINLRLVINQTLIQSINIIYYNFMTQPNQIEVEELQEPQVIEQKPQLESDHIPLKDQFSSDLSEIDIAEYAEKHEQVPASLRVTDMKPKKKKIIKNYRWKNKWIKIPNIINGSAPLLQKKWVKVRYVPTEDEITSVRVEEIVEKQRGALEMAHAIIQGQMNKDR